jgi:DNA-binding NarL/FixJ family response regulator
MSAPLRILIIDDHDDVRRALMARLNSAPGMTVVGETADAEEGLLKTRTLRPDVVVVETKRTDGRGLEIVSWIAQSGIGTRVIVLTSYPSEWERWAAHRAGAARYLLKDIASPLLIEHIRSATTDRSSHDYCHPPPTSAT